jgi:predicted lipoprotein with Yx(FWY)xxD motif
MIRSLARQKARNRRPWMLLALPAATAAAALMVGCSSSGTSSGGGSSGNAAPAAGSLKTAKIGGATVLTNSKGFTVYTFALDTSTKSNCNGTCATNWPPVKGSVTAAGIKGTFGTIKRSDGSIQAECGVKAPPPAARRPSAARHRAAAEPPGTEPAGTATEAEIEQNGLTR